MNTFIRRGTRALRASTVLLATLVAAGCSGGSDSAVDPGGLQPIRSVRLTPPTSEVGLGGTLQLKLLALDASDNEVEAAGGAVWASADTLIATVSQSGLVTGRRLGVVQLQAVLDGKSAFSVVTVVAARVAAVAVAPATASTTAGGTVQLSARTTDAGGAVLNDRLVFWQSSNDAVARVTSTGLVSGVAAGTATITATSEQKSGTATVTVAAPGPVTTRVDVSPASAGLVVGGTQQLTATPRDAAGNARTGRTVTWTSSDATVAAVNGSGVVTAVKAGAATITATADGVSGTAAITVTAPQTPATPTPAPVARVELTPTQATIDVGARQTFTARLTDAGGAVLSGRSCTWSGGIATSGKNSGRRIFDVEILTATSARAVGRLEGNASIVATCEGRTGSAVVTVKD